LGFIEELDSLCPKNIVFNDITGNLVYYGYPGIAIIKKTNKEHKNYHHNLANLKGQIYEAYICEILYNLAKDNERINKIVLKGPYVKQKEILTGFGYDKNRIIYFSFDEQIAEFDELFFFNGKLVFVEITTTTSGSIIMKNFVNDIKKKTKLLMELFDFEEVYSLVVTPKKINSLKFKELSNCVNWVIPNVKKIDHLISKLSKKNQSIKIVYGNNFIKVDELETKKLAINKRRMTLFRKFMNLVNYKISKEDFFLEYSKHWWCVNRIYLGSIPNDKIKEFIINDFINSNDFQLKVENYKKIVFGVKLEPNSKPMFECYLIPNKEYISKFEAFQWKDGNFMKRKSVIKKSTILRIVKPEIIPNDKQFWKKITNLCEIVEIPEFY